MWDGIEFLLMLQSASKNAPQWIESFFIFLSSPIVYEVIPIIVAGIFIWFVDRKKGLFVALNAISAMTMVEFFKFIFKVERPWIKNSEIIMPPESAHASGYSFPSGHSAVATSAFGSIISFMKNKYVVAGLVALIALICFGRLYLMAHTPVDVFAGILLALAVMFVNWKVLGWMYKTDSNFLYGTIGYFVFFAFVFAVIAFTHDSNDYELMQVAGFMFGIIAGMYIGEKTVGDYVIKTSPKNKVLLFLGFALVCLALISFSLIENLACAFAGTFLCSLFILVGAPMLARKYF